MPTKTRAKPINWRSRFDSVLALLFIIKHDPKSGFADMRIRCPAAEKLNAVIERNKRFLWRKVGQTWHLYPAFDKASHSVAFIVKEKAGRYSFTIMAKGFKTTTDHRNTESLAKASVEHHFELLRPEEE